MLRHRTDMRKSPNPDVLLPDVTFRNKFKKRVDCIAVCDAIGK